MKNTLLYVAIVFIYFLVSYLFPWNNYLKDSTISSSYFFDFIFSILLIIILKIKLVPLKLTSRKRLGIVIFGSFIFGWFCLFIANYLEISIPLHYVNNLFLQLFILAPLSEELVYRGLFYKLGERTLAAGKSNIIINSVLYGFSYLIALLTLPAQFHSFIYFQVVYSFFLGFICCLELHYQKNITAPILVRIGFSLALYFGVFLELI